MACQESKFVGKFSDTQCFKPTETLILVTLHPSCTRAGLSTHTWNKHNQYSDLQPLYKHQWWSTGWEVCTWCGQLGYIWHNNQGANEVTFITGLRWLHSFGPQNHLHTTRNGAPWQLSLCLLDTHLESRQGKCQNTLTTLYKQYSSQRWHRASMMKCHPDRVQQNRKDLYKCNIQAWDIFLALPV